MTVKKIHHIAFLVRDLDATMKWFEHVFGVSAYDRVIHNEKDIGIYKFGETLIEFLQPLTENSVQKQLAPPGGFGFYHVAYEVDSIDETSKKIIEMGGRMLDMSSSPGLKWKVAGVEPASAGGVYVQLIEPHSVEPEK